MIENSLKIKNYKLKIAAVLFMCVLFPTAASASLTSGLVGYWTFDGKDTNWNTNKTNDLSGQGNTGTMTSMSTTTSPIVGKIGQALKFDGVNDHVNISNTHILNYTVPFTVSSWFKVGTYVNASALVDGGWSGGGGLLFGFFVSGNFKFYPGGAGSSITSNASFGSNSGWHQAVGVWDGTKIYLYIDGVSNATPVTSAAGGNGTYSTEIGVYNNGTFFNGSIDDVRVYNRALSAGEVRELYKLGAAKFAVSPVNALIKGLVGYWTFDGKDTNWGTNKTNDLSGQGNTGTLVSMSTTTSPVVGKIGQALKFNGTGYVNNTGLSWSSGSAVTVVYWENSPCDAGARTAFDVGNQNSGTNNVFQSHSPYSDNVLYWDYGNNGNGRISTNYTSYCNKWTHVALVNNGTNFKAIYLNGALITSGTTVASPPGALTGIQIGNWTGSGGSVLPFKGNLDDFRIYNRALSATEVKELYNIGTAKLAVSPVTSLKSGLVGYWTFDGKNVPWTSATAATAIDSSGQGNTGTLTSMNRATSPVVGKIGQGLKFNGNNQYVETSKSLSTLLGGTVTTGSISWWAKPSVAYNDNHQDIMFGANNGGNDFGAQKYSDNNFYVGYTDVSSGNRVVVAATAATWPQGKWVFYTYTWTTAHSLFYVNGVQTGSDGGAKTVVSPTNTIWIGANHMTPSTGVEYPGSLDDVRIYNRALSAGEVKQLYNIGH